MDNDDTYDDERVDGVDLSIALPMVVEDHRTVGIAEEKRMSSTEMRLRLNAADDIQINLPRSGEQNVEHILVVWADFDEYTFDKLAEHQMMVLLADSFDLDMIRLYLV